MNQGSDPGWREPMLATLTDTPFSNPDWLFERKLDGVRVIVSRRGDAVELWSRNHRSMNATYPELVRAFARTSADQYVVDGEIVAFDGRQTSFARLQPRINLVDATRVERTGVTVYCYLFDVLDWDGTDISSSPLRERKRLLRKGFDFTDPIRYSSHRNAEGEAYLGLACSRGWEGLIAKRADASYRGGRTKDWLKLKCVADQEFVIGGFTEPKGSRGGLGALLVGYYDGERLRYAGKVGTGFDKATLRMLRDRLGELERTTSPFAEPLSEKGVHWVRPELVAQIGFTEWTNAGKLRHPRYVGLRHDKAARDVVRERPKGAGR